MTTMTAPFPDPDDDHQQAGRGDDHVHNQLSPVDDLVLVDQPTPPAVDWSPVRGDRWLPIIPGWLRSRRAFADTASWAARYIWHTAAFHTVRCPKYAGLLVWWCPRGLWRTLRALVLWVFDAEGYPLRRNAVESKDPGVYLKLAKERRDRVRLRLTVTGAGLIATLIAALVLSTLAAWWTHATVVAVLLVCFGLAGVPRDKHVLSRAVITSRPPRLTSDVIVRALGALGISEINKALAPKGSGISFPAPITRDGPGWRADIDLPYGVTVPDILDRREPLASGLRRPLGCVWPEPAHHEHAGRLVLWVGDEDMNTARQPAWPLLESGTASVFELLPFGSDPRGRLVAFPLIFTSVIIGAKTRMGKTFALRVLLLATALDPLAQLNVYDLKGTGDLDMFAPIAHRFGVAPSDHTIEHITIRLRELVREELPRRAETIRKLPRDLAPENKVTPELAAQKSRGLYPIVLAIDECHELFTHPVYGQEATDLCTRLLKLGPAMGIIVLLATQRPDKDSLPKAISANIGTRFCLRVMGQPENDMILGTSAYRSGLRATQFADSDKGIGILTGHADNPQIVHTANIDAPAAEAITIRARALRDKAGTLTGHATGNSEPAAPVYSLLADIAAVIHPNEQKIWNDIIVDRLAELRPHIYGQWATVDGPAKTAQLTTALKPYGVPIVQVWSDGQNRRGITAHDIHTALHRQQHHDGQNGGEMRPET